MENKIKKFRDIYFEDSELKIDDQMNFSIVNELERIRRKNIKILSFINEDDFLKNIKDLYLIKFIKYQQDHYEIYFTYKDNKFIIDVNRKFEYSISISKKSLNGISLMLFIEQNKEIIDEVKQIARILVPNIKNNSTDRVHLLLNNKGE